METEVEFSCYHTLPSGFSYEIGVPELSSRSQQLIFLFIHLFYISHFKKDFCHNQKKSWLIPGRNSVMGLLERERGWGVCEEFSGNPFW